MNLLAEQFEAHRPRLTAVAQRMLGSRAEADDAVQEAWIRVSRADSESVHNMAGWLTTIVGRVCLNMLQSRTTRREDPLGETDVAGESDPEDDAVQVDAVGGALVVVLDTLAPAERLAFVLHDLFAVPFEDIAPIVDRTPAATRQLASRARRRVRGAPPETEVNVNRRREVVEAFLAASRGGDFGRLLAVLDPDVVVRADAAAVAMGADALVRGADAVAKTFAGRARAARLALVDYAPAAVWMQQGATKAVFSFSIRDGRIVGIDLVMDAETIAAQEMELLDR